MNKYALKTTEWREKRMDAEGKMKKRHVILGKREKQRRKKQQHTNTCTPKSEN